MERVRFIDHRGQRILLIDYSHLTDEHEMLAMIQHRKLLVSDQEPGSLLTLVDATGAQFSREVITHMKEAAVLDTPYVKRAAVVGEASNVPHGTADAVESFTRRHWERFNTRAEALDWLVSGGERTAKAG